MTYTYKIIGMTCKGCQFKVQTLLNQVPGVTNAQVNLLTGEAVIETSSHLSANLLQNTLKDYPKYQIVEKRSIEAQNTILPEQVKSNLKTYQPLLLILVYILSITFLTSFKNNYLDTNKWMNSFMAGFFIVFSFFKLLRLTDFATSYAMYDIVAKRIKTYGLIYPFIELALGIAYLVDFNPIFTNIATLIIMSVSSVGVIQSVIQKQKIKCACLGTVFNLPMSTITIIENLIMILMAGMLLVANL